MTAAAPAAAPLAPPLDGMLYLANPSTQTVRDAMNAGIGLGAIDTPAQGNPLPARTWWAADNGVYGKGYPGDREYLRWLERHRADRDLCLFATAPDVVGDAFRTLSRFRQFAQQIRDLGYPVALVFQDGMEYDDCWDFDDFDVMFIGGSTSYKLGPWIAEYAAIARSNGKWVHMGRVNSQMRWEHAVAIDCNSVDGTFLTFGPDTNLPQTLGWLRSQEQAELGNDHRDLYPPPEDWYRYTIDAASREDWDRQARAAAAVKRATRPVVAQPDLFSAVA